MKFNSYNSWNKLNHVLVGSAYSNDFFSSHPDNKVADALSRVNQETTEDLNFLSNTLQELGIQVTRTPDYCSLANNVKEAMDQFNVIPKPMMTPRDHLITLGNRLVQTTCDPQYTNWNFADSVVNQDQQVDAACILRVGRDIIIDNCNPKDPRHVNPGVDNFVKNFFDDTYRVSTVFNGRHTDALMNCLRPGLIISAVGVTSYEKTFPGWDVVTIPKPDVNEYTQRLQQIKRQNKIIMRDKKYWIPGEENNQQLNDYIDAWFSVGNIFESNFDVNVLSINENTIITSGKNIEAEKLLKSYGIETIVCPIRHRWFWDGGIHCVTVDLNRTGDIDDYFPERKQGIDFGIVVNKEEQTRDATRGRF